MKFHFSPKFLSIQVLAILLLVVSSCSKNVTMTRLVPAPVTVPSHVQKIVLVDRTKPQNEGFAFLKD